MKLLYLYMDGVGPLESGDFWVARGSGTTDRLTSDRVRGDSVMLDPSARRLRVRLPVEKS